MQLLPSHPREAAAHPVVRVVDLDLEGTHSLLLSDVTSCRLSDIGTAMTFPVSPNVAL